jgi:hypothetical protein
MMWDAEMALDPKHWRSTGMTVKTADLNDELGRVRLPPLPSPPLSLEILY